MEQPLLKVIEKRRRPTDGVQVEEIIYLVPELCVLAGMTEEMRTNGQLRHAPLSSHRLRGQKLTGRGRGRGRGLLPPAVQIAAQGHGGHWTRAKG